MAQDFVAAVKKKFVKSKNDLKTLHDEGDI